MGRIQYAVFDLDGTIIDSEWAHEQAKTSIIAELGGQEDMIDLKYFTGRSNRLFWRTVLDKLGKEGDVDRLVERQFAYVMAALKRVHQPESPGLTRLLRYCRDTGRKTAVCSGSDQRFVVDILDYLGVKELYDVVISAKDATRLKPAPDVYLAALAKGGIQAEHALGFEDSYSGCLAVHAAGMRCVGYTAGGANPQDLGQADFLVPDLTQAIQIIQNLDAGAQR